MSVPRERAGLGKKPFLVQASPWSCTNFHKSAMFYTQNISGTRLHKENCGINGSSHQMPNEHPTLAWPVEGASACPESPFSVSSTRPEAGSQWLTAHGSAPGRAKQAKSLNKATALQAQAHLTGDKEAFLTALAL